MTALKIVQAGPTLDPFSAAIKLAGMGLHVFRIKPLSKRPFDPHWTRGGATSSVLEASDLFIEGDYNLGVFMGASDLVVIDVDVRIDSGLDGFTTLSALGALPTTFTVRTPTGGAHYYFRANGVKLSQSPLGPGIDVKTGNGYVVGPGSRLANGVYTIEVDVPFANLPQWIADRAAPADDVPSVHEPLFEPDSIPAAVDEAIAYVSALPLHPAGTQNPGLIDAARRCFDLGCSVEKTAEILNDHFPAHPAIDPEKTLGICERADDSYEGPRGKLYGGFGFEPLGAALATRPKILRSAAEWIGKSPKPIPFVIDRLFPQGFVSLLVSAGGRGKSTAAQQALTCVASGSSFLGYAATKGAAAGIFCEDEDNTLHTRQVDICRSLGIPLGDVAERLTPTSLIGTDATLWTEKGQQTEFFGALESELKAIPDLKMLVVDGTAHVFGGSEIERRPVTLFITALTGLAQRLNIAVVLIHHESKSSKDDDIHAASGSTAWINASRSVIKLNDDKGDVRTFVHIKANLCKRVPSISCSLASGAFVPLNVDMSRRDDCRDVTEKLMRKVLGAGERLSPSNKANNYVARWLAKNQGAGTDFTEAEFEAAVSDLSGFAFEVVTVDNKSKPTSQFALIRETPDASPTHGNSDASDASPTHP